MKALTVIKIGGKVIDDDTKFKQVLKAVATWEGPVVLIHGGGSIASEMEKKLGLQPNMNQGRRVTSQDSLEVVIMVYAGLINKTIVAKLQEYGKNAIGLSGADGNTIMASKRSISPIDYGYVGDVTQVNSRFLENLLEMELTPVFSAITHDKKGQLLNTNADTLASEIAKALSSKFKVDLVIAFEKNGVLDKDGQLIDQINQKTFELLVKNKTIQDGMIPKLSNAFAALNAGVCSVKLTSSDYLINKNMLYTEVII